MYCSQCGKKLENDETYVHVVDGKIVILCPEHESENDETEMEDKEDETQDQEHIDPIKLFKLLSRIIEILNDKELTSEEKEVILKTYI